MAAPTASRDQFGGVAVEERDQFGGVPVSETPRDAFGGVAVEVGPRAERKAQLQQEQTVARREGRAANVLQGVAGAAEWTAEGLRQMNPITILPRLAWNANQLTKPPEEQQAFPERIPIEKWTPEMMANLRRAVGGPGSTDITQNARLAGVANAASDLGEFFVQPETAGVSLAGAAPALARAALATGFAGDMTAHLPESMGEAGRLSVEGDPAEATRANLNALANFAFAAGIPAGAVKHSSKVSPLGANVDAYLRERGIRALDALRPLPKVPGEIDPALDNLPAPMEERGEESKVQSPKSKVQVDLPEVPGVPMALEGQPYEEAGIQNPEARSQNVRGEAAMETRPSAGWTPDGPREPVVSPELADAIEAVRRGYEPEVETQAETSNVQRPSANAEQPPMKRYSAKAGDDFRNKGILFGWLTEGLDVQGGSRSSFASDGNLSFYEETAGTGSDYVTVTDKDGEQLRIRYSNHFAPGGGGYRVTEMGSGRSSPPDYNVVNGKIHAYQDGKWVKIGLAEFRNDLLHFLNYGLPEDATGGPKAASAGIKTPLGSPEAGKGSVVALQPEGASALTRSNESPAQSVVKPAEVRSAEPGEKAQPPAEAAPAMQEGMDNLRFTSEPVKRAKAGGADAKDAKAKLIAELEKAVEQAKPMTREQATAMDKGPYVPKSTDAMYGGDRGRKLHAEHVEQNRKAWEAAVEKSGLRKVTVEIPGDGTFTVWNTRENLAELLKKAKRLETATKAPKGYSESGVSKEDREWTEQMQAAQGKPEQTWEVRYRDWNNNDLTTTVKARTAFEAEDTVGNEVKGAQKILPGTRVVESGGKGELRSATEAARTLAAAHSQALVEHATHVVDVVRPLEAKMRELERARFMLAAEAAATKPDYKGKKTTKKAFLEKNGFANAEEANARYRELVEQISKAESDLIEAKAKEKALLEAREKIAKDWSRQTTRVRELEGNAKPDIITKLEASRDRFGSGTGGQVNSLLGALPETGRAIWRTGHNLAIDAIKAGRSAREAIEEAWAWMQSEWNKANIQGDRERLKAEFYEALGVRQQARRWFEDPTLDEEAKRGMTDVFIGPQGMDAAMKQARGEVQEAVAQGKLDRMHNLVAAKMAAGKIEPQDVARAAALMEEYNRMMARPETRAEGIRLATDLLNQSTPRSTDAAQILAFNRLLAANPVSTTAHMKGEFLGKVGELWEKITGGGKAEDIAEGVRRLLTETRETARKDPSVQAAAGEAVLEAVMREADKPGSPLYSGIVLEASNALEKLPSVLAKARAATVRQWQRIAAPDKEFVHQIATRAGQGLENAIWSAVKKAGGDQATVQKVMAQLNRSLHEQLNRALGVRPEQFDNPQTYLQRLKTVLNNSEQMSRVWAATREAVNHNLAALGDMRKLVKWIEEEQIPKLAAEKRTDIGLESQTPAVRAEGKRLRDARVDEDVRRAKQRAEEVKAQIKEFEEMEPAWRTVLGLTVDVWGPGLLKSALREQMKANDVNLARLVANHFRGLSRVDPEAVLKTLADKIVEGTGLDKPTAERLAKDLEREYKTMVERERANLRKRIAALEAAKEARRERVARSRSVVDREAADAAQRLADGMTDGASGPTKPAVQEFYVRLVGQMRRLLPETDKATGRKLSDIEVIREALTNADKYEDVWRRLGEELRARHGIEGLGEVKDLLGPLAPVDLAGAPMDRLIRERLREKKLTIGKLVRETGMTREAVGKELRERLASEAGLTGEAAQKFLDVFERRWQRMVNEALQKHLDKLALDPKLASAVRGELHADIAQQANAGTLTDARFFDRLKKRYGLPEWTPEIGAEVLRRNTEIHNTPEGIPRDFKIHALYRYLRAQRGGSALDYAREMYYSNLFNSTAAWARNAGFNQALTTYRLAVEFTQNPKAFLDIVRSGSPLWGAAEGLRDAGSILAKGEVTGAKLSKFDEAKLLDTWRDSQSRIKRALGTYFSVPMRMLSAGDIPYYRFWQEWEWAARAREEGKRIGLAGDKLREYVDDVLDYGPETRAESQAQAAREGLSPKPTEGNAAARAVAKNEYWRRVDEIIQQKRQARFADRTWAADAAEQALFNTLNSDFSNTPLGRFGRFIAGEKSEATGPMMDAIAPVVKVVVNAADMGIEATPGLNWLRAYEVLNSKGTRFRNADTSNPFVARRFMANFVLSHAAVAALAAWSASQEDKDKPAFKLHGRGPADPSKRKQLPEGWQPHSFQIGDKYYNLGWLGPLMMPLDIVANYQDAVRYGTLRKKDAVMRAVYALNQIPAVVLDQAAMQGMADTINFFSKESTDDKLLRTAARVARTAETVAVPGWARQIDQLFDDQTYSAQDIKQAMLSGIPYARRTGSPDLDWRGQPLKRGPFDSLAATRKVDPLGAELLRLGLWVNKPAPKELWEGVPMTPAEQYEFTQRRQQAIYKALNAMRKPDADNHEVWQNVVRVAEQRRKQVEKLEAETAGPEELRHAVMDAKMDHKAQDWLDALGKKIGEGIKAEMKGRRLGVSQ